MTKRNLWLIIGVVGHPLCTLRLLFPLTVMAGGIAAQQPGTIAIDEQGWQGKPFRHLYIHGVLNGDTAFRIYMPTPSRWKGRLIQWLQGGLGGRDDDGVRMGHHVWALQHGAVYVESSQGHLGSTFYEADDTPSELAYEASYAVAQYAKARCVEVYGTEPRYSYVFGGSGGGVRASGLLERFPRLYDGAVAVVGVGDIPFIVYLHSRLEAYRPVIQPALPKIAEATRVPGQGDPFGVLGTVKEQQALRAILSTGYPRHSLWLLRPLAVGLTMLDFLRYKFPRYFEDFWQKPEYVPGSEEFRAALVDDLRGVVRSAEGRRIVLDKAYADQELYGYTMEFLSGELAGQWRRILGNLGAAVVIGNVGPGIEGVKPGDQVRLNNRDLIAWRALHRYLACDPEEPTMKLLLTDGTPACRTLEPEAAFGDPGRTEGRFAGKMIVVFGTDDPLMWPTVAVRYHRLVRKALGAKCDEHFRLYFLEHGGHGAPLPSLLHRQVPNRSTVYKAMEDLLAWVEEQRPPVAGTTYALDALNQLVLPPTAAARKGYQPVLHLNAREENGQFTFQVEAEDPDNRVVRIQLDYEGDGKFDASREVNAERVVVSFTHRYQKAGIYYPTALVTDSTTSLGGPVGGIQNVAWVRVLAR